MCVILLMKAKESIEQCKMCVEMNPNKSLERVVGQILRDSRKIHKQINMLSR